jgi:hypothetical protein
VTDNEYLKSSVAMFGQGQWTLRDFVDAHAIDAEGGFTVGSPTQVADDLQSWVEGTDVDGFNLTNVITPARSPTSSTSSCPNCNGAAHTRRPTTKAPCATSCLARVHAYPKPTARRATAVSPRR